MESVILTDENVTDKDPGGINYYLDRLPSGYQLMDYPKLGDDSFVSYRL
jgi:hypothetical protein